MHRLGVYRIRPSKQIFSRTPGSRSLRWDVTEIDGEGDGEGRFTRFVSRTLINQSYDCQRISQILATVTLQHFCSIFQIPLKNFSNIFVAKI